MMDSPLFLLFAVLYLSGVLLLTVFGTYCGIRAKNNRLAEKGAFSGYMINMIMLSSIWPLSLPAFLRASAIYVGRCGKVSTLKGAWK